MQAVGYYVEESYAEETTFAFVHTADLSLTALRERVHIFFYTSMAVNMGRNILAPVR